MTRGVHRRRLLSVVAALCAHALLLLGLGYRIPATIRLQTISDEAPEIELTVIRPAAPSPDSEPLGRIPPSPLHLRAASPAPRPSSSPTGAAPAAPPAPSVATAPSSGSSGDRTAEAEGNVRAVLRGSLGCADAGFNHLTEAEKRRCADRALAQGRNAPDMALADIDPLKRAYYDAVAAAYDQQSHGPPMAGRNPSINCSIKFSGLKIVRSKPPPHSLSMGPCFIAPPQGFLTEESGVAPPGLQ